MYTCHTYFLHVYIHMYVYIFYWLYIHVLVCIYIHIQIKNLSELLKPAYDNPNLDLIIWVKSGRKRGG